MVLEAGMDLGRLFAAPVSGGLAVEAEGGVAEVAVGSVAVAAGGVLAGLPFGTPLAPRAAAAPPETLLVFFFVVSATTFFGAVAVPHARPATPLLPLSSWLGGILPRECVVLRSPTPSEGADVFLTGGVTLALLGEGVTEVLLAGVGRALPWGVGRGGGVEDDFFLSRSGRFLLVLPEAVLSVAPGVTLVLVPDEGKERDGAVAAAEGATGPTFFLLEEVAHAPPFPWFLFFPFSPSSLPQSTVATACPSSLPHFSPPFVPSSLPPSPPSPSPPSPAKGKLMISSCALLSPPQEEGEERDGEAAEDPGVLAVLLFPPTPTSTPPFPVLLMIMLLLLLLALMLLCFLSTPIVRMRASPGAAEGGTGRWTTWRAFRRRPLLSGAG